MFGHLKAEDFVNLMDGAEPSARRRSHLDECTQCSATWQSLKSIHTEVTSLGEDIAEPDWAQFRSSVRDRLLSRSVQRESAVRRWTGWAVRPAGAWALLVLLAVGIPTGAFLWHLRGDVEPIPVVQTTPPAPSAEYVEVGTDAAVFDDLIQLTEMEQEQLRQMLESAQKGTLHVQ